MNAITLRVKNAPGFRIDGSNLLPATLAAASRAELPRIVLQGAGETCALGDLFDIALEQTDMPALTIEGDAPWLDRIGANMTEGALTVHGHAGDYAGIKMSGGELHIQGDAGAFAACEMQGGRLSIHGNAGDFAAGALPGDMEGMTGGMLVIHGNAGARLADRMRRGTVLVAGDAGDFAASRLVAGSVCIGGKVGAHLGYGMRRGTVLLMNAPARLPPTFTEGGHGFDTFWLLFTRMLAREIAPFSQLTGAMLPRRYAGDLAVDGRGELLIANS
ncbi:Formyltransferase/hydrolase complex Fhc subunit C [Caballeronia temeraria]|uniref:Formyltransferase/hydrolase complex Fhc subunit C n=1 Tax=Caballeronia temeraria TaxID=1777137 RepID=A0A158D8Y1_9BURK|nr:formylmethanofuran dehydrogenase subunit C [Caballeronia temeraria]SAK91105.1 Formyltransferase/hydrolase complex Fhc subunit C [Caballeronia temeraria]